MPSSSLRGSVGPYKTVNLYCNTCDSQIGIYENEWIRPTTSYVIPKEKGTNFAINVAEKSQTADGKNIGALSGCALSEASCANCSKGLGQYCRTAPGKEHLVGQYVYKLSKTYLKDTRTFAQVAFNFAFAANMPSQDRARSMFTAPPRPAQSPSPYPHSLQNSASRRSMAPPDTRFDNGLMLDPALTAHMTTPVNDRRMSVQPVEPPCSSQFEPRDSSVILEKFAEQDEKLWRMSESVDHLKIMIGRLVASFRKWDLGTLAQDSTSDVLESFMEDFESMVESAGDARAIDELETLRAENATMKVQLHTIASAMGNVAMFSTPGASSAFSSPVSHSTTPSVLGKRKRVEASKRSSLLQHEVSFADDDELNDHSDLFEEPKRQNTNSSPMRPEKAITPAPSANKPNPHYRQMNGTPSARTLTRTGDQSEAIKPSYKIVEQVPTPPESNITEQDGSSTSATEPNRSQEPERREETALSPKPQQPTSAHRPEEPDHHDEPVEDCPNAISATMGTRAGVQQVTTTEKVVPCKAVTAPTSVQKGIEESHAPSSQVQRPQRTRKPTSKVSAAEGAEDPTTLAESDKVQTENSTPDLSTAAAHRTRRQTTAVLPQESRKDVATNQITKEKAKRRKTTDAIPGTSKFRQNYKNDASRLRKSQRNVTNAPSPKQNARMKPGNAPVQKDPPQQSEEDDAQCEVCERENSSTSNAIVFCDGCDRCWHQRCHDPALPNDVVVSSEAEWFCNECAEGSDKESEQNEDEEEEQVEAADDEIEAVAEEDIENAQEEETEEATEDEIEEDAEERTEEASEEHIEEAGKEQTQEAAEEQVAKAAEESPMHQEEFLLVASREGQQQPVQPQPVQQQPVQQQPIQQPQNHQPQVHQPQIQYPQVQQQQSQQYPGLQQPWRPQQSPTPASGNQGDQHSSGSLFQQLQFQMYNAGPQGMYKVSQQEMHNLGPQTMFYNNENERPIDHPPQDGPQPKQPYRRRNKDPNKPKRIRRRPEEIERRYKCLWPRCAKAYGELPHLNTHILDSAHGVKMTKAEYDKARTIFDVTDTTMSAKGGDDTTDLDGTAEEGNNQERVVAAMAWDRERRERDARIEREAKMRQLDQMAKAAMDSEMMATG